MAWLHSNNLDQTIPPDNHNDQPWSFTKGSCLKTQSRQKQERAWHLKKRNMADRVRQSLESYGRTEPGKGIQACQGSWLLTGGIHRTPRHGGRHRGSKLKMSTGTPVPLAHRQRAHLYGETPKSPRENQLEAPELN